MKAFTQVNVNNNIWATDAVTLVSFQNVDAKFLPDWTKEYNYSSLPVASADIKHLKLSSFYVETLNHQSDETLPPK